MLPALLGLFAPVAAIKAVSQLLRAARSLAPPASLSGPPAAEKAAEVSEPKPARPVIFAYDGMSRRTKITELTNGAVTSKKLYFWLGGSIVCERDGLQTGFPLTKRYFPEGLVQGTTKLYYCTDHLGSVRELVDSTGAVRAEYSYSTYGEQTKASGDLECDWGWSGLWNHKPSGLYLATYRAFDPVNKRWISRDPLGEGVDANLYRYVNNSPLNLVDPEGLDPQFSGQNDATSTQSDAGQNRFQSMINGTFNMDNLGHGIESIDDAANAGDVLNYLVPWGIAKFAANGPTVQHHSIPQEFRSKLEGILDVDDYIIILPESVHRQIHGPWNAEWREFLKKARSKCEIESFAKHLEYKYLIRSYYTTYRRYSRIVSAQSHLNNRIRRLGDRFMRNFRW